MSNLRKFLVTAKRNTYATQKGKVPSSRKSSKDLAFVESDYYYLDSYFVARKSMSEGDINIDAQMKVTLIFSP